MPANVDPHPAGFSGSQWTQHGRPVSESYSRPSARMQLGMPAYDLRRMTEGPTLYLNGPPDAGMKVTMSTDVASMAHGRFATGHVSRDLTERKVACNKSNVGPDPYNVNTSNPWHQRTGRLAFHVDGGEERTWRAPRPVCARSLNLDPYSTSTRDNPWSNFGRTSSAAMHSPGRSPGRSPSRSAATAMGSARSSVRTYYFSPFPESLSVGSRAHTPRSPQGTVAFNGAKTQPLSGAKAWDWAGVEGVMSPGGIMSPGGTAATLPPLPAACRSP